jgi:hypothetical protein
VAAAALLLLLLLLLPPPLLTVAALVQCSCGHPVPAGRIRALDLSTTQAWPTAVFWSSVVSLIGSDRQ